jgi:2-succinyl-6-hydroxy-2,4-cyclohexadiene-1-carboxylate synthase
MRSARRASREADVRYLLLHGFTGTPDGVSQLDPAGVAPTLGGHLGTPITGSFDDEVERLAQLAGDCQGLLGYSLGGRFALGLLARYPRRFAHAVVISAHPGLPGDAERAARREGDLGFVRLLRERGLEAFVDVWQALPLWASQGDLPDSVKAEQRRQRLRHEPEGLAQSLVRHGLGEMPNLRPALADVKTRVELLVGERDTKFVALGRELLGIMPHAHLTVARGAGHNLLLERPGLVSDLLQREPVP